MTDSKIKRNRAARRAVDNATATLLARAAEYQGVAHSVSRTYDILTAAREYGRAMARLESVGRR
jgi:hypothetical protein